MGNAMKKNKIVGIFWFLLAAVLFVILIASFRYGKGFTKSPINLSNLFSLSTTQLVESKDFQVNDIMQIDISLLSESISIETTSDDKISVEVFSSGSNIPQVNLENSKLIVKSSGKKFVGKSRVVVKLPDFNFLEEVKIKTMSGSVKIDKVHAEKLICNVASGSVFVNTFSGTSIDINSVSGSIHFDGLCQLVNLSSLSGSINTKFEKPLAKDINISSKSGSIRLDVPSDSDLSISYKCTSGSYKNKITGTYGKQGKELMGGNTNLFSFIHVESTSGSINIE